MASDKCMGISTNPAAAGRAKSGGKIDAVSGTVGCLEGPNQVYTDFKGFIPVYTSIIQRYSW